MLKWCCKICPTQEHTKSGHCSISRHYIKFYFILFYFFLSAFAVAVCVCEWVLKCNTTRIHQYVANTQTHTERRRHSNRYKRLHGYSSIHTMKVHLIRGKCTNATHTLTHTKWNAFEKVRKWNWKIQSKVNLWHVHAMHIWIEYADKINKQTWMSI